MKEKKFKITIRRWLSVHTAVPARVRPWEWACSWPACRNSRRLRGGTTFTQARAQYAAEDHALTAHGVTL